MNEGKSLEGLDGWLVLVGLGIVISPLRSIVMLFSTYSEMFSNGSWDALTTPESEAYNPLWAPILYGEMAINGALILTYIFVALLFFSKRKAFPKWYIGMLIFSPAFILLDALAIKAALPNEPIFDPKTIKELGYSLIGPIIWIPYMITSKRVRATFIK